jgi:hypothetical protein
VTPGGAAFGGTSDRGRNRPSMGVRLPLGPGRVRGENPQTVGQRANA